MAAIALAVVAVIVAGLAVHELTKQKSVLNTKVPFKGSSGVTKVTSKKAANTFVWPIYGLNDARTRVFVGPTDLEPPFKTGWKLGGNGPLEFPPDIDGNVLFFMDDHATVNKVNATTGHVYWREHVGVWSAASPALDPKAHLLFVPVLSKTQDSPGNGQFVALSMKKGTTVWSYPLPSGSESSPLVWHGTVYFGDSAGTVHALNALTGKQLWSFPTSGPEKGGPTLYKGILYFGNYAGQLFAVNATTGKQVWEASPGGTIYASPTVAYGRVYVGSTNGFMYSYSDTTGTLGWSIDTGNYVYSSAAVDDTPKLGPTVYVGSYTGTAYALNAETGTVDWKADIGDSISGAASIVNNVVYFSGVYHPNVTRGYNITTGKEVFTYPDGAYTATVASPKAVYLMGHYVLYQLLPTH